jgi:large subunit ribosomal protein L21
LENPLPPPDVRGSLPALFQKRTDIMAYAIFKTGGKQYRVKTGDTVAIEKLDAEAGSEAKFDEVLFVGEGASIKVGSALKGLSVVGEVVEQIKAPKVTAYKYRRRKGYHRTVGHRQKLTRVKITSIPA